MLREDDARLRVVNGVENFAILSHFALNLLTRHPAKLSLKHKRFNTHSMIGSSHNASIMLDEFALTPHLQLVVHLEGKCYSNRSDRFLLGEILCALEPS